jgi:23S rRNA pseudouridine2605 synthase
MAKKKPTRQRTTKKKVANKPRPKQATKSRKTSSDTRQRLQRVMAAAGVGSRRECELIIEEGRVEIDGNVVTTLGVKVDPKKQEIYVDAQPLVIQRLQYFILNKPPGVLSTSKDPSGRPRVIDLIKTEQRVYNVGRLDQSSEGLILVTNDGDLANQLTHPRYGVEKKYHVQVVGVPEAGDLRKLEQGVYIAEGLARATKAKFLKRAKSGCWLEIVLAEGRNREIRRMLAGIGHKVRALKRVSIGPLKLGELPRGAHRPLTSVELKALKRASSGTTKPRRAKPAKTKTVKKVGTDVDESTQRRKSTKRKPAERPAKKKTKTRRVSASGTRGAAKNKKKSVAKPRRGATNPKRGRKSTGKRK